MKGARAGRWLRLFVGRFSLALGLLGGLTGYSLASTFLFLYCAETVLYFPPALGANERPREQVEALVETPAMQKAVADRLRDQATHLQEIAMKNALRQLPGCLRLWPQGDTLHVQVWTDDPLLAEWIARAYLQALDAEVDSQGRSVHAVIDQRYQEQQEPLQRELRRLERELFAGKSARETTADAAEKEKDSELERVLRAATTPAGPPNGAQQPAETTRLDEYRQTAEQARALLRDRDVLHRQLDCAQVRYERIASPRARSFHLVPRLLLALAAFVAFGSLPGLYHALRVWFPGRFGEVDEVFGRRKGVPRGRP